MLICLCLFVFVGCYTDYKLVWWNWWCLLNIFVFNGLHWHGWSIASCVYWIASTGRPSAEERESQLSSWYWSVFVCFKLRWWMLPEWCVSNIHIEGVLRVWNHKLGRTTNCGWEWQLRLNFGSKTLFLIIRSSMHFSGDMMSTANAPQRP